MKARPVLSGSAEATSTLKHPINRNKIKSLMATVQCMLKTPKSFKGSIRGKSTLAYCCLPVFPFRFTKSLGYRKRLSSEPCRIAFDARSSGDGVGEHSLHFALTLGHLSNFTTCCWRHLLIGDGLEEFSDPYTSRVTRRPAGRKD